MDRASGDEMDDARAFVGGEAEEEDEECLLAAFLFLVGRPDVPEEAVR